MPKWAAHLRPRLASLRLSPAREHEIVEELSQHLEDCWRGRWRRCSRHRRRLRSCLAPPLDTRSGTCGRTCGMRYAR